MAGQGNHNHKVEVESLARVSVFDLAARGCFEQNRITWLRLWMPAEGRWLGITIRTYIEFKNKHIQFSLGLNDANVEYAVKLVSSSCYFGGSRYWFECPNYRADRYCGRRVGILYLTTRGLACSECLNLSYRSQNFNHHSLNYRVLSRLLVKHEAQTLFHGGKRLIYAGRPTKHLKKIWSIVEKVGH